MWEEIIKQYESLGISKEILLSLNQELKLPNENLLKFARKRREELVSEAISWPKGPDQENRKLTILYKLNEYTIGVAKPGKEAAPDYKKCTNYITKEKTNNPNDMLPLVLKSRKKVGKDSTFEDMFETIEHLMRADIFGLEVMGMLLFRAAYMLDHKKDQKGNWRYEPPQKTISLLEKKIPIVRDIPVRVFLHFLEVLALNEDVKVYTLGHNKFQDYGRINTLLTFTHLISVFLNRRSISQFAGAFARPPSGMAPIPKTKITEWFPLLSQELFQKKL